MTAKEEEELRNKILELDGISEDDSGSVILTTDTRIAALIRSLSQQHEREKLEALLSEREYTWKLVNDIRYENITLNGARDVANDRLSWTQIQIEEHQSNGGEE